MSTYPATYRAPVAKMATRDSLPIHEGTKKPEWFENMLNGKTRPNLAWNDLWDGIGADEDDSFRDRIGKQAKALSNRSLAGTKKKGPLLTRSRGIEELDEWFKEEVLRRQPNCSWAFREAVWNKVLRYKRYDDPSWGREKSDEEYKPDRPARKVILTTQPSDGIDVISISSNDSESEHAIPAEEHLNDEETRERNKTTTPLRTTLHEKGQEQDKSESATAKDRAKIGLKRPLVANELPITPESMDRSSKISKLSNEAPISPSRKAASCPSSPKRNTVDVCDAFDAGKSSSCVNSSYDSRSPTIVADTDPVTPIETLQTHIKAPKPSPNAQLHSEESPHQTKDEVDHLDGELVIIRGFKPTRIQPHGKIRIGCMQGGQYLVLHEGKFCDDDIERIFRCFKRISKAPLVQMIIKLHEQCQVPGMEMQSVVIEAAAESPYSQLHDFVSQGAVVERSRAGLDFVVETIALDDFYGG